MIPLKTREQFVTDEIAAIQAQLPNTFQFPVGSVVNALVEAHGATAIWEESLIQYVLAAARLSTSTGTQVISFLADFGLVPPPPVQASGEVNFSSASSTSVRTIPVGSTVSTNISNGIDFNVIVDLNNEFYDPDLNAYVMPINTPLIPVPVQCQTAGIVGNVLPNTIVVINSPIVGVDFVTNPLAFTNGRDNQTDQQLRAYFVAYLNGLSKATMIAVESVLLSIPEVEAFNIVENQTYSTNAVELGYFYVVIDDGTGMPPSPLITAVYNAINPVRPLAVRFAVFGPELVTASVTANIVLPPNYSNPTLITQVELALTVYIRAIPFGETFFFTRIPQIIYSVIDGLNLPVSTTDEFNVDNILLNGGTTDLTSGVQQRIVPGTFTITTS